MYLKFASWSQGAKYYALIVFSSTLLLIYQYWYYACIYATNMTNKNWEFIVIFFD